MSISSKTTVQMNQTSLLEAAAMQEPVTVRVMGVAEPSMQQVKFSYLESLFKRTGANVNSKGTSVPGWIEPLLGWTDNSGGKSSVFH